MAEAEKVLLAALDAGAAERGDTYALYNLALARYAQGKFEAALDPARGVLEAAIEDSRRHGSATALTREAIGWAHGPFDIPADVLDAWRTAGGRGAADREAWERLCRKGMAVDYSWHASAGSYLELYRLVIRRAEEAMRAAAAPPPPPPSPPASQGPAPGPRRPTSRPGQPRRRPRR